VPEFTVCSVAPGAEQGAATERFVLAVPDVQSEDLPGTTAAIPVATTTAMDTTCPPLPGVLRTSCASITPTVSNSTSFWSAARTDSRIMSTPSPEQKVPNKLGQGRGRRR